MNTAMVILLTILGIILVINLLVLALVIIQMIKDPHN